jgi:hypothetical protein
MEKYGTGRQAADNNMRHMRFRCWMTKTTNTHSEYVIITAPFAVKMAKRLRPQCYLYTYIARLFREMTPCRLVNRCQCFGRPRRFRL